MVRIAAAIAMVSSLSGCYYSNTDLVGVNARTINGIDNIIISGSSAYYIQGSGKSVSACYLQTTAHLAKFTPVAAIKVERTIRGNYIVQAKEGDRFKFGLWFRSKQDSSARSGLQCFVWLGQDYISPLIPGFLAPGPNMAAKRDIAGKAQIIAPGPVIDRPSLLALTELYERELQPLGKSQIACINERMLLNPGGMRIEGDNRHMREFE